ncbi:MAG TPA: hypothetical protein VNR37_03310 [Microbacteriaceae bacterium]|nr:hypothetical protein [Microbacteriaceae bacterium]
MSDTLAALLHVGQTVQTPLWDAELQRPARAVVTSITAIGERLRVSYRYPSGYTSGQWLSPHDRIPVPESSDLTPPRQVGTG